jgi:hypothetical protein
MATLRRRKGQLILTGPAGLAASVLAGAEGPPGCHCVPPAERSRTRNRIRTRNVALPAKSDSGVSHRPIPADGEGKILKFWASFSEDQKETIDLGGRV